MVTLTRGVCRAIPRFFAIALAEVTTPLANETWPAFVLVREDEDRIAFGDVLASIHRLLRAERERLRPRVVDLGFDREHHTPLAGRSLTRRLLISHHYFMAVHGARPNELHVLRRTIRRSSWKGARNKQRGKRRATSKPRTVMPRWC